MSINKEKKTEIINEYSRSGGDTGSPEVQIAILSERISSLTNHFQTTHVMSLTIPTSPSAPYKRTRPSRRARSS